MTKRLVKVSIAYCAECGYDAQAVALAGALLRDCQFDLSGVELIPWQEGSFEVSVAGDLVHSMYRDGGFPETEAMVAAVRARANGQG